MPSAPVQSVTIPPPRYDVALVYVVPRLRRRRPSPWLTGCPGTVLLDGHTYRDGSAVFGEDFPSRVRAGQLVQTVQQDGSVCSYQVDRVWPAIDARQDYPRIVASEHLYDPGGPERLFLATCGGRWNEAREDYDDITVLVATALHH